MARARSGPHGSIVRPSGVAEGKRPDTDAGEGMNLGVSVEVERPNVVDVSDNIAGANKSPCNEVAEPFLTERIVLDVDGTHLTPDFCAAGAADLRGHGKQRVLSVG